MLTEEGKGRKAFPQHLPHCQDLSPTAQPTFPTVGFGHESAGPPRHSRVSPHLLRLTILAPDCARRGVILAPTAFESSISHRSSIMASAATAASPMPPSSPQQAGSHRAWADSHQLPWATVRSSPDLMPWCINSQGHPQRSSADGPLIIHQKPKSGDESFFEKSPRVILLN
jgi:hypothetical protein